MREHLKMLAEGKTLSFEQAEAVMHLLLSGEAEPEETAGLLLGLRARGETLDELTAFAAVMRAYAVPVDLLDEDAIDLCGTGGDATGTFNISTAAALVCAGAGATVAKHGNRSISSQCGSADVLEALGARVDLHKEGVEFCLHHTGIAFIFAPFFHPALKYVMPVRRKLGVRTFFNILGPLCNPAGVQRQLVGAFSEPVARQMAAILMRLGARRAVTVHSSEGMDEFSISGPSQAYTYEEAVAPETIVEAEVRPEDLGLRPAPLEALRGGGAEENAAIIAHVLNDVPGPHRDVVLFNAAYALWVSGRCASPRLGLEAARESLATGAARRKLAYFVEASHAAPTS